MDTLINFILIKGLSFSELVFLNYLRHTDNKAKAIWQSMNFISRSAAQTAFRTLSKKGYIKNNKAVIDYKHSMVDFNLKEKVWRPYVNRQLLSTEE